MLPLFERRFHIWLTVVKDSSFLYFIAENLMPLFLYKRRKKKKTKYLQVGTMECEVSRSLHPRGTCVHVLCAGRSQRKSGLDMSREDLFERG